MSDYPEKRKQEKKAKAKRYIVTIIVVLAFFWVLSIAQSARSTAESNRKLLTEPAFTHSLVLGGPDRFEDRYNAVVNADTNEGIKENNYLWSTLILQNTAHGPAETTDLTIHFTRMPEKVLLSSTQYGSEGEVKFNQEKKTAKISFEEIGAGEYLYLFFPHIPASGSPPYSEAVISDWRDTFTDVIERVVIETGETESTYYGSGFASR